MPSSYGRAAFQPIRATPNYEGGGEDPFICAGGREMGLISLLDAQ
jgi:hypothetical protein